MNTSVLSVDVNAATTGFLAGKGFLIQETAQPSIESLCLMAREHDAVLLGPRCQHGSDSVLLMRRYRVNQPVVGIIEGPMNNEEWSRRAASFMDSGGDDLHDTLTPPEVVEASLRACIRRAHVPPNEVARFKFGEATLEVDLTNTRVKLDDSPMQLTSRETWVLLELARPGVRTRDELCEMLYGVDAQTHGSNTVEVFVTRLRKKLGDHDHLLLKTVRGKGYELAGRIS